MTKFVKSNAIVYARDQRAVGIGDGQIAALIQQKLLKLRRWTQATVLMLRGDRRTLRHSVMWIDSR
ncbi:hypothetical protein [Candidatus Doolittlea endobia]|uniref:hypothetical protein n=1 Tax=Candidatus Doolittlea endobia TaxID=1778262 RepID=UPI0038BAAE56